MYITTLGLVLRATEYKESSCVLTVLTASHGKLTVTAKGARRKGSKIAAAAQLLTLSEMTIFENRDRYTLAEARTVELFRGLREDIGRLALGTYFGEVLDSLSDEDAADPELLSLGLNALYALSEGRHDMALVKAAFELRAACLAGFEPILDRCAACGRTEPEMPVLSLQGGAMYCRTCRPEGAGECLQLPRGTLDAMRYIVTCPPKRLYAFSLGDSAKAQLGKVCEGYLLTQLGRGFGTLEFYRKVM